MAELLEWMKRVNWNKCVDFALDEAKKSPCLRMHFGSIIVNSDTDVIGRGFNKPPYEPCKTCPREELHIPPRTRAEYCHAYHAEQWAILDALNKSYFVKGAVLVVAGYNPNNNEKTVINRFSCTLCARTIAAYGLAGIVAPGTDGPKFKTTKEAYDEAYAIQIELMKNPDLNSEAAFNEYLKTLPK
ncbi:hypothetical protein COS75_02180 [Candidatus Pacearchaeota archaeon CG06_land_8_20_14_3_00_35_12]|nr:MAG: hypothetical protein COS75_02180 [Candidatus Pacearchaeota archaeon CG06_land_8_20_14_3_00_35_12]